MFCYQCQETAGCTGCTRAGVCGKSARTAALQDLLVYVTRGLCQLTTALRNQGEAIIPEDDRLLRRKCPGLKRATETKESEKIGRGALHAGRSSTGRSCGLHGRENAGMSSEIEVGIL